jgi:hypothetical protein
VLSGVAIAVWHLLPYKSFNIELCYGGVLGYSDLIPFLVNFGRFVGERGDRVVNNFESLAARTLKARLFLFLATII